ncbi:hypothetical protein C823_003874 [Eubacterium plexicaudatum ASF492]|nr:hypothetical protein C823_003874 [Eubacterium plexicaudatum ASF492]
MKILFVINTLGLGGAETALLELLRRLSRDGCEISLYVMLAQGELADRLPDGVKLLNKNYRNCSVLSAKGRLEMAKTVLACFSEMGMFVKKQRLCCAPWLHWSKTVVRQHFRRTSCFGESCLMVHGARKNRMIWLWHIWKGERPILRRII